MGKDKAFLFTKQPQWHRRQPAIPQIQHPHILSPCVLGHLFCLIKSPLDEGYLLLQMFSFPNTAAKIIRKVRLCSNDLLFNLGCWQTRNILSKPGQRILVYHGIDQKGEKALNGRHLSATRFEAQIRFLKEHTQIVSLDDYFAGCFDHQRFAVALTFDDGYQNNLHYALPVLEKYSAPATFFLTSSAGRGADWLWMDFLDVATRLAPANIHIDGRPFFKKRWRHTQYFEDVNGRKLVNWARYSPWKFVQAMEMAFQQVGAWDSAEDWAIYWKLLTPPEIREMAASPFIHIGAHSHTHQDLAYLSLEAACTELKQSKDILEKICGQPIKALAYPFGAYTRPLLDFAEQIGFSQQLAVDFLFPEDHTDPRLCERLVINPYISANNQWLAVKKGRY
jgi:peptidoglycan/xylan/chitin deacetylase (PgdA/CDA1 family)